MRACALQYKETRDTAADVNASAFANDSFDIAGLSAVSVEGVRVWLAVYGHSSPTVGYDFDMGGVDVRVCFNEVGAEYACEELGRCDWVLFGFYVNSVLHRVRGDHNAVVGSGISVASVRYDR